VYSQNIAYGPTNKKAVPLLDKQLVADLPTAPQNIKSGVAVDVAFWADYGESLEQRFNAWAAK
jgi:putative spermidine/putrescine transport system substrate-binding protein